MCLSTDITHVFLCVSLEVYDAVEPDPGSEGSASQALHGGARRADRDGVGEVSKDRATLDSDTMTLSLNKPTLTNSLKILRNCTSSIVNYVPLYQ